MSGLDALIDALNEWQDDWDALHDDPDVRRRARDVLTAATQRGEFTPRDDAELVEILGTEALANDARELEQRLNEYLSADPAAFIVAHLVMASEDARRLGNEAEAERLARGAVAWLQTYGAGDRGRELNEFGKELGASRARVLKDFTPNRSVMTTARRPVPRAARRVGARRRSVRTGPRVANAPPDSEGDKPGDDDPGGVEADHRGLRHVGAHLPPALRRLLGEDL
jgi:hypothetical protein